MKKVLGLVISHRKLGNSEILVKEIMRSIPGEYSLELLRLTDLKIDPCKACYRCLQPDTPCPTKDDFNYVIDKIKSADALIIGLPVYILGPHGYYKMLIDRLLGAENYAQYTEGKPCVIVNSYGLQGWQGYSKAAALTLPRFLRMKVIDCWQVQAALPSESLLNPANLEYARSLGRDLFSNREHAPGIRDCQLCGSDLFRLLPDRKVECPICGAQGVLDSDNQPVFTDSAYYRFSQHAMEEHFKVWLVEMKNKFLAEKDNLKEVQKGYKDLDWWSKPQV